MKKPLCLLLSLALSLTFCPAALAEAEAVTPTPPAWVAEEDYLIFPQDPVYQPGAWEAVLALRDAAASGGLLPYEGRDWAQGSAGECYETALVRLKCAENYGADAFEAGAAFLSAGRAFEAAESAWYDQNRGRDRLCCRLAVEKYRAYLIYNPDYVDNWGQRLVPNLDAVGMTLEDFFDGPYMDRVSRETREKVEQSAAAYWEFYLPEKSRITLYVDGLLLPMDTRPQVRAERTMAPIRALAEALGAQVEWDPETWEVTLKRAGSVVSMTPGQTTAYVDGVPVEMDVAPYADQNRTYFPVRYAAEFFGQTVTWNPMERRVDVTEDKSLAGAEELEDWALPMAALLSFSVGGEAETFGFSARPPHSTVRRDETGAPQNYDLEPARQSRELLADGWEVPDRETLLRTVRELLDAGSDPEFQTAAGKVRTLSDREVARRADKLGGTDRYMWPWTKELWTKWGRKGIRAWDLCRAAALSQWGYTAGYLTYEEALGFTRPAAEELAKTFESWDQVYENFLEGYYWCLREDLGEKTVWDTELGAGYQYLKSAPDTRGLFDDSLFGAKKDL